MLKARVLLLLGMLISGVVLTGCTRRKTAALTVLSETPLTVTVDGHGVGSAPLQAHTLSPGSHTILLQPHDTNLVQYQHRVTFLPGVTTVIHWQPGERSEQSAGGIFYLEPLKGTLAKEIFVTSIPDAAQITLGDTALGTTPITRRLPPEAAAETEIKVTAPGYVPVNYTLSFHPGFRTVAHLILAQSPDQLPASPIPSPVLASPSATSTVPPPRVLILSSGIRQQGIEGVRVYQSPNTSAETLGFAITGQRYQWLETSQSGWMAILLNGQRGWVNSAYVSLEQ